MSSIQYGRGEILKNLLKININNMKYVTHLSLFFLFACILNACSSTPEKQPAEWPKWRDLALPVGQIYTLDSDNSQISLVVLKEGPLANKGHNHVISVEQMTGRLVWARLRTASRFRIEFPVNQLRVDDPKLRLMDPQTFDTTPNDKAIRGTQDNLLGNKLLDAETYPVISIEGIYLQGEFPNIHIESLISIKGGLFTQIIPVDVVANGTVIDVSAGFELRQSELGIKPFSVFGGALRVSDTLKFTVQLHFVSDTGH